MGLFTKIGQAVKNATKVVSLNNIVKVATNPGSATAIAKEAANRAIKSLAPAPKPATTLGTPTRATTTAKGVGTGITGVPTIDAAIGGALAGAGVQIAGTDVGNAAGGAVAQSAFNTWFKANWPVAAGVVAAVVGAYYAFFRNPVPKGKKVLAKR